MGFGKQQDLMDTLDIWDLQLIQYGTRIIDRRKKFVEEINEIISSIHRKLTGGKENLQVIYEPSNGSLTLEQALARNLERDLRIKSTSVGPHRDDICFMAGDLDIRRYGSQGQQRTAALSLKLSEIELVKQAIHDTPVLLLDDVLSELDKHRQNYLLDSIHDIQTLITCTGVDEFVNHRFSINKVFHVQNGQVAKEN
jgi:DNA replication and repair protein RecF